MYEDLQELFTYSESPHNILDVEHEVLMKTHNLLQHHLEERLILGYSKVQSTEFPIDMRSFCNYGV